MKFEGAGLIASRYHLHASHRSEGPASRYHPKVAQVTGPDSISSSRGTT